MKNKQTRRLGALALLALATISAQWSSAFAQGTAFTYQGRLQSGGDPASGTYNFAFSLFSVPGGGYPIGSQVVTNGVVVTNGLFVVTLDYGASAWNGETNWLAIEVETNGASSYTILSPRQQLTPTPYAIYSETAGNLAGSLPVTQVSGVIPLTQLPVGVVTNTENSVTLGGSFNGNGIGLTNLNASNLFSGVVPTRVLPNFQPPNYNTVGGGYSNSVSGPYATVGGGNANTANGLGAAVSGGYANSATYQSATVGGGYNGIASALGATVGGGYENTASGPGAFVGGGGFDGVNSVGNVASGTASAVAGGVGNQATNRYATVGGGNGNNAGGAGAFIGGGGFDGTNYWGNIATGGAAVVAGGYGNQAVGTEATVGGGANNYAGPYATVSGGADNYASGPGAFIGGGGYNGSGFNGNVASGGASVVAGGMVNEAQADYTTVGGGFNNEAQGTAATVPGGYYNSAIGQYSFAAGQQAQALNDGTFVWSDNSDGAFASTANNQFLIRAQGGVGIGVNDPAQSLDVGGRVRLRQEPGGASAGIFLYHLSTGNDRAFVGMANDGYVGLWGNVAYSWGLLMNVTNNYVGIGNQTPTHLLQVGNAYCDGNTWSPASDRNLKAGFAPVNAGEILAKVVALPITRWHYTNAVSAAHLGPMAQDFYSAFATGADDRHIADVDEGGVALAAIQGLNAKLNEKDAKVNELEHRLNQLEQTLQSLTNKQ